jgi:hypothetical protein
MTLRIPLHPSSVAITRHAVTQLLIRFPSDLLPRDPRRYIASLIQRARPAAPTIARRYRLTLRPSHMLHCDGWILPLIPSRSGSPPWVLPTLLRRNPDETRVPTALRQERLRGHAFFQSGHAVSLLRRLILETGSTDPELLGRLWRDRGYPLVLWGGFESFAHFCTEAWHGDRHSAAAAPPAAAPDAAAG